MKFFVLFESDPVTQTEDVPPEKWLNDFVPPEMRRDGQIIQAMDPNEPGRMLFTNQIRAAVASILVAPDDAPFEQKETLVNDLLFKCVFYWITGVMSEFNEKAPTHNGYVKIQLDNEDIEYGWLTIN